MGYDEEEGEEEEGGRYLVMRAAWQSREKIEVGSKWYLCM
jgi:hypothetical protein